ncbi:hypothetical protein A2U01_0089505, partial [Trifolium medium]|nr:hypothetical protein [Trifolium medium]
MRSSGSSGFDKLRCSEEIEEPGNNLQLTSVYKDACH